MDKQGSIVPNVEGFLLWLSGALTQYDQRASKRRGYNPYSLAHYMKALDDIRKEVRSKLKSDAPEDLELLKKSIKKHIFLPPADRAVKVIDAYLQTGKAPLYPGTRSRKTAERVADRFIEATEASDPFLTAAEVSDLCPKLAFEMVAAGLEGVRSSDLDRMVQAAKWDKLPKGWTQESVKKFWGSLTGDRKHKVTACIKKMKGGGIDDPGAFCASLADKMEPGWRSQD